MVKIIRRIIGIVLVLLAVYMIILSSQEIIEGEKYYYRENDPSVERYIVHNDGVAIEYVILEKKLDDISMYVYAVEEYENGEKVYYFNTVDKYDFYRDYDTDEYYIKPTGYLEVGIVSAIVGLALFIPDITPKKDKSI